MYTAVETSITAFTRALACSDDVIKNQVKVNCLCPGVVDMDVGDGMSWQRRPSNQQYVKKAGKVSVKDAVGGFLECIDGEKSGLIVSVTEKGMKIIEDEGCI